MEKNRLLLFYLIIALVAVFLASGCQESSQQVRPLPEDCLKNVKTKTYVAYIPLNINKYGTIIKIGDPEKPENTSLVMETLEKFQNDHDLQILSWNFYTAYDANSGIELKGLCVTFFKAKKTELKNETPQNQTENKDTTN